MAWAWRQAGFPFHLLTRIGDDRPEVFLDFLDRHGHPLLAGIHRRRRAVGLDRHRHPARPSAPHGPLRRGRVGGPAPDGRGDRSGGDARTGSTRSWSRAPSPRSTDSARPARCDTSTVVGRLPRVPPLHRRAVRADDGPRRPRVRRLARRRRTIPTVDGIRDVAFDLGKLVVRDARVARRAASWTAGGEPTERLVPVTAIPVAGTTVGCGDAFIAAFLASFWRGGDLDAAVEAGKVAGARRRRPGDDHCPTTRTARRRPRRSG